MADGIALACFPNEAAWEYAFRADAGTGSCLGDGEDALRKCGWFGEDVEGGVSIQLGDYFRMLLAFMYA